MRILLEKLTWQRTEAVRVSPSELKYIQNKKLREKGEYYKTINRKAVQAKQAIVLSNNNLPVGSKRANSLEFMHEKFSDFMQEIDKLPIEEKENMSDEDLWNYFKARFKDQKEMYEACLDDVIEHATSSYNYIGNLYAKFNRPSTTLETIREVEEETAEASATPTNDFIDQFAADEPIDPFDVD